MTLYDTYKTKTCNKCDKPLSLSHFYVKHNRLEASCKVCTNKRKNAPRAAANAAKLLAPPTARVSSNPWEALVYPSEASARSSRSYRG